MDEIEFEQGQEVDPVELGKMAYEIYCKGKEEAMVHWDFLGESEQDSWSNLTISLLSKFGVIHSECDCEE